MSFQAKFSFLVSGLSFSIVSPVTLYVASLHKSGACTHFYFHSSVHNPPSLSISPHYLYRLYSLSFLFPVLLLYPCSCYRCLFVHLSLRFAGFYTPSCLIPSCSHPPSLPSSPSPSLNSLLLINGQLVENYEYESQMIGKTHPTQSGTIAWTNIGQIQGASRSAADGPALKMAS